MVVRHLVQGYENFVKFFKDFKSDEPTYVLYTGSPLEDGKSWCPDCVIAHPYIEEGINSAPETFHFVVVEVGDRAFWKDPACPFRTDSNVRISNLPTLVKWGTQKRLVGDELLKKELIEMLLEDSD